MGRDGPGQVAVIAGPVHRSRQGDDEGQAPPHHGQGHFVVRRPLGALIRGGQAPIVPVRLVDHPPPRVAVDRQAAGVDPFGNAKLAHHLEHMAGPGHVHRVGPTPVVDPHRDEGGQMEHSLGAAHRPTHRFLVEQVADVGTDSVARQRPRLLRGAHQCRDQVALGQEARGQVAADEAGSAGDEVVHPRRMLFGERSGIRRRGGEPWSRPGAVQAKAPGEAACRAHCRSRRRAARSCIRRIHLARRP